jgi:hypothetical protein
MNITTIAEEFARTRILPRAPVWEKSRAMATAGLGSFSCGCPLFQFQEQNLPDNGHSGCAQIALALLHQTWTVWRMVITSSAER